jgi:hypothetical protein
MGGFRGTGPGFGFNGTRTGFVTPGARAAFAQAGWRGGNWQGWRGGTWRGANWRFNGHRRFVRNAFFFGSGLGFASDWWPYYSDAGYYPSCWYQRVFFNGGWVVQPVCSSDYSYY